MKKTELVLIALCVIGSILRAANVHGGTALCGLSMFLLALFYLLFTYFLLDGIPFRKMFRKDAYRDTTFMKVAGGIICGIVLCIAVLGLLFGRMNWTGTGVIILMSDSLVLLSLIASIVAYSIKKTPFSRERLLRIAIFSVLGLCNFCSYYF